MNDNRDSVQDVAEEDSSPRHKHLKKLAAEAEALKKAKQNIKPSKIEYELVHDTRGKPKYRKVIRMPNGTKHWLYVPKTMVEKLKERK